MTARRQYTADEVLRRLQDISSDFSGDDLCDEDGSDDDDVLPADVSDGCSNISSDSDTPPLRQRISIPAEKSKRRKLYRGESRGRRNDADCDRSRSRDCRRFHCSESEEPLDSIQPGKDGTQWSNLHVDHGRENVRHARQNILHEVPGPTRFAKANINTVFDAFIVMIDVTMVSWIANFTQLEAIR